MVSAFPHTALDLDPRQAGGRASREKAQFVCLIPGPLPVNPFHKWKVLDVSFRTNGNESAGDQPGTPPVRQ